MTPRRNILYVTTRLPYPPDKGDKIRTFHHLDRLALSHNVYCACFVDDPADASRADELRRWCRDVFVVPWSRRTGVARAALGAFRGKCLTESAYSDRVMHDKIAAWGRRIRFDVAVAFSSATAGCVLKARADRRVLDLCDVDSAKWGDYARQSQSPARYLYAREARLLRRYESACLRAFDAVMVISNRERELLDAADAADSRLTVVPNGVRLYDGACEDVTRCGPTIGFVGAMDYRPNVDAVRWFARTAWPAIRASLPDARLMIIGRNPSRAVKALARDRAISVTGEVRDPSRYISRCRVMIAPLRIVRGMPNKVLEYMAARRPVIATPDVAAAIGAEPDRHLVIAEQPECFGRHAIELCRSDAYTRRIAAAGHDFVATHFNWAAALDAFERVVMGESSRRAARLWTPAPSGIATGTSADKSTESSSLLVNAT